MLAFSCKRRYFCPSCHQKRVVEFGEWLCAHVLRPVPHRHFVMSIPKILRRFFLRDRRLLAELSRCGWEALKTFLQSTVPETDSVPGGVIAVQTFGDFPDRFHPHLHILCSDGVFCPRGVFRVAAKFNLKDLEQLFRHKVLRMLLARGKINCDLIRMMEGWRHSGFNVYAGPRIHPRQKRSLENLAAYLIRSSFSQQRMEYRPEEAKVTYRSKDRKEKKSYDAPEWLAAMGSHVPERGQQSVRYYGAYANSTRGRERKREADDGVPTVLEPDLCSREIKRNWSRLIRKVYETDPLVCPRCEHPMRVIASIENPTVIRRILEHLRLWLANARSEPRAHSPPVHPFSSDAFFSQLSAFEEDDFSQAPPAHWEC
jgi:hypothetical protein